MKISIRLSTALILASLVTVGCATARNKALDEKVAQETDINTRKDLQSSATKIIENDADLTSDQKKQLSLLRTSISSQLDDLSKQSLKLRSVLVEEVLSPNYSLDEVNLIKSRMKKLEDKRLTVMFDGVDRVNAILGRQAPKHPRMMRALLEERGSQPE